MPTRTRTSGKEYETLRLINVGGKYYAFQQKFKLVYAEKSKMSGGVGAVKMPMDQHRLKPLDELVDIEELAADALGGAPVDSMEEL